MFNRQEFEFGKMKIFWQWMMVMATKNMDVLSASKLYHEKWLRDFLGGPLLKTWSFCAVGMDSIPDQGSKVL